MTEHDDYWQHDMAIGEARFWRKEHAVRLKVHESAETHNGRIDLLPRRNYRGEKLYFHAKPYILLPDISLTVGLYDRPQGRNIGEVTGSTREGMRHQDVGQAQAWYFTDIGLLEIWESYLEDAFREKDPTKDRGLRVLWRGVERFLVERLEGARRIITPGREPIYSERWQEFLEQMGYRRLNKRAFEKRP